jgi:hypothetical protein
LTLPGSSTNWPTPNGCIGPFGAYHFRNEAAKIGERLGGVVAALRQVASELSDGTLVEGVRS